MRQNKIKNKIILFTVIAVAVSVVLNSSTYSKTIRLSQRQNSNQYSLIAQSKPDEITLITQKLNEISKELETAKYMITLQKTSINEKNNKIDELTHEILRLNDRIADITKTYEMDKENYLDDMSNKSDELELSKCRVLELSTKINQLENSILEGKQEKTKPISNKKHKSEQSPCENNDLINRKETLDNYRTTVLEQSKQLSKCNDEIDKINTKVKKYDVFIDDILNKSMQLSKEGKKEEATVILTLLTNAGIERPELYIELIKNFKSMGLTEESNKVKTVLYSLYPSLKADENFQTLSK
ncbi:MAG: hypothetical protein WCK67_01755 [bacterium]